MSESHRQLRARVFNEGADPAAPFRPDVPGLDRVEARARAGAEDRLRYEFERQAQERLEDAQQRPLTERQLRFCEAYLAEPVGARAAARAGYSPRSAPTQATRMLRKANVLQKIAALRHEMQMRYRVDRDSLLDEIEESRELAIESNRPRDALRATELKAKLVGLVGPAARIPDPPAPDKSLQIADKPLQAWNDMLPAIVIPRLEHTIGAMAQGPGYRQRPDHRVAVAPAGQRVRVTLDGTVLAESDAALRLEESGYAEVYYLPRDDAEMVFLARTEHSSHCPFKGEAAYWSVRSPDGRRLENAVWSYERPYDEVAAIKDHLAFWTGKFPELKVEVG